MTPLSIAEDICKDFISQFGDTPGPCISRALIIGSIRRRKTTVNDGDILYIPENVNTFGFKLHQLKDDKAITIIKDGDKIKRVRYRSLEIDLYRATVTTWATLQLIYTGSKNHNIRLCQLAHTKGFNLKADGSGLIESATGKPVPINHEVEIFAKLGHPFINPDLRD